MPVQYTPQFIPTNTQALQGVLSEYQQAYDQNLSRELEIQDQYSMIPTINAADTQKKNEILGEFANTMGEVEKKYNYDRASSSYSKELARKIGELRKNDFWSYNERKKEVAKLDQEMKARLGANYFSPYDPMSATYENQESINKYRPMDKRDLAASIGATAKEKATSIKQLVRNPISIKNELTGAMEPFVELGEQLGYTNDTEAFNFLSGVEGQKWLDEALAGTAFAEYAKNPEIRQMATQAAMQNLVGERRTSFSRMDIPNEGTSNSKKQSTPWVPIGSVTVGSGTVTPEKVKNTRQGEKTQDYETSEYYNDVKTNVLNNQDNIEVMTRGKSNISKVAPGLPQSVQEGLFDNLTDMYLTQGTGKGKEFFDISGNAVSTRTFVYDYLKSRNIDNPGRLADRISNSMDSWYKTELRGIKKDISSQLERGLNREYSIAIPPIQPKTNTDQVVTFVDNVISQYAVSATEGEADIIDPKKLNKFRESEGDVSIAMLQSPGKIPILRLVKGDVKSGSVLDVTMNPKVSGYAAWAELARETNTPSLLSDAYFSNINMVPNVEYSIGENSPVNSEVQDVYKAYLTDMIKADPNYANKSANELYNVVTNGLEGISWKEDVDEYGDSIFRIYNNNQEIPIENSITSVDELMYRLSNLVKV